MNEFEFFNMLITRGLLELGHCYAKYQSLRQLDTAVECLCHNEQFVDSVDAVLREEAKRSMVV